MATKDTQILDPTPEIDIPTIKNRSIKGVVALTSRYFVLYAMALVAQVFLGIYLSPVEWGIFALVSALVDFLVYFSDVGLAASLIQSKDEISDNDLKTTFTVQMTLVLSLLFLLFVFSNRISAGFSLSSDGVVLMYMLGFSLFLSSLRTIPTVLLERKIEFHKIAFVNIVESIFYYTILVVSAWKGLGIKSFTFAVGARGVVGLFAMYSVSPWIPKIGISLGSLKKLLGFGVPYQVNTLIALAKDRGTTLILGKVLGLEVLGILDWAQKWSQLPLRVILDSVTKVTFPAFSRLQNEKKHLPRTVTRSIFFITLLTFPAIVGLVLVAPMLVRIIPQYEKWIPAMVPLALFSLNTFFASFTTQLTNLLNAIGKIKYTFYLMVMWTILTLTLVPYLGIHYGTNGAAFGFALVSASSVVAVYISKKFVNFSVQDSILKPLYAATFMGIVLFIVRSVLPLNTFGVSILIILGVVVYSVAIVTIIGKSLFEDAKKAFNSFFMGNK